MQTPIEPIKSRYRLCVWYPAGQTWYVFSATDSILQIAVDRGNLRNSGRCTAVETRR